MPLLQQQKRKHQQAQAQQLNQARNKQLKQLHQVQIIVQQKNTGSSSSEQPVQPTTPSDNGNNGGQTGGGTVTPPTPEPEQPTPAPSADPTINALNVLRQSLGLRPVVWDAGLATSATARAAQVEAGGIPNDHWSRGDEVIAIMWAPGNSVIMAWYNETNMVTASGSGHRDWEINPGITRVGFWLLR